MTRLVCLCSSRPVVHIHSIDMHGLPRAYPAARSILRGDIRAAAFRWMVKETKVQLQHCPKEVDTIFIDTLFGKSSSEEAVASIRSAVMGMALSLATSLNDDSLAKHATLYFRGSKIVLESFSRLRAGGVGVDNDENMVLRERCYGLIEEIARRSPLIAIADPQIIAVLFKLLDREDERLSPRLYAALGSLRDVYKERTSLLAQDKTSTENGEGGMKEENHEGDKAMEMALEVESSPQIYILST